jgi:hypothetical protein
MYVATKGIELEEYCFHPNSVNLFAPRRAFGLRNRVPKIYGQQRKKSHRNLIQYEAEF